MTADSMPFDPELLITAKPGPSQGTHYRSKPGPVAGGIQEEERLSTRPPASSGP